MKTPLLYGAALALVGALLTYGLYFAGYHDSAESMKQAQWISLAIGVTATITCLALAMRDRRAEYPADRNWGYGAALGTGVMTGLWSVLIGAVLSYIYFAYVHPEFQEVVYQAQAAAMEEKGLSSQQIEQAAPMMRRFIAPVPMTVFQALGAFVWSVILSLIVAIFFRKRELPQEALETATPPPLG